MQIQLTPKRMAEIYWVYKRGAAIPEVKSLLKMFEKSEKTVAFWQQVLADLESRASKRSKS